MNIVQQYIDLETREERYEFLKRINLDDVSSSDLKTMLCQSTYWGKSSNNGSCFNELSKKERFNTLVRMNNKSKGFKEKEEGFDVVLQCINDCRLVHNCRVILNYEKGKKYPGLITNSGIKFYNYDKTLLYDASSISYLKANFIISN